LASALRDHFQQTFRALDLEMSFFDRSLRDCDPLFCGDEYPVQALWLDDHKKDSWALFRRKP
jgi:hypothetical protein